MLACALDRYRGDRAFEYLQQRLLHALAGDVAGDRRVLAGFSGDLVDLVDVDDAVLSPLDVPVGGRDEPLQHGLHVISHIPGLGERRGVGDDERHIHNLGEGLREIRLADAGRAEQQYVGFGDLDVGERIRAAATPERLLLAVELPGRFVQFHVDALVMVVDGDRQRAFRRALPDDVPVEIGADLGGLGQRQGVDIGAVLAFLRDDVDAQLDAFVADGRAWACDQLAYLMLGLAAERAPRHVLVVTHHAPHAALLRLCVPLCALLRGYPRPDGDGGIHL